MSTPDLLSQDEIDALLHGLDDGEIDTSANLDHDGVARSFDFNSQDRIIRGRMPTLEMVNERFARELRITLFNMLRKQCEVSVGSIQVMKFGEYGLSLLVPSSLNITQVKPLRGTALFVLDPKLVYSLVENFFGGDGRFHTKIEGRDFTATERRVTHLLLEQIYKNLVEAWAPVKKLRFEHVQTEVNPQFANIVTPTEVVVVCTINVELQGGGGEFQMVYPYSMLEPIRELLDSGVTSDLNAFDERWSARIREDMQLAVVELRATLAETNLKLRDLLSMDAGDIIPIELPDKIELDVEGVPVLLGDYGEHESNYALKVSSFCERQREQVDNLTLDPE